MWRLTTIGMGLVLAVAAHLVATEEAFACSAGQDFDPVASSGVIVEGRFLGYEVLPDAPFPGVAEDPKTREEADFTRDPYVPVRVDMAVERIYKGTVQKSISIVDHRTLSPPLTPDDHYEWIGASGACGAFDTDPTGKYAIMGLTRRDDGTYGPNRLLYFFYGNGPQGDGYAGAVAELTNRLGAGTLPAAGSSFGARHEVSGMPAMAALAGAGALLIVGAAALRIVRRRSQR